MHSLEESENYIDITGGRTRTFETIRVVCCSDTHGKHRSIDIPQGDIFIHAGDFTRFSKLDDVIDFNNWLGDEEIFGTFKLKIVVNGNHENNAPWQNEIRNILCNATFLKNEWCEYKTPASNRIIKIYGTDFFWPMQTRNPYYEMIPIDTDILVCHCPVKGYVDGGHGCQTLLKRINRINYSAVDWPIHTLFTALIQLFIRIILILLLVLVSPLITVLKTAYSRLTYWPQSLKDNMHQVKNSICKKINEFGTSCSDTTSSLNICLSNRRDIRNPKSGIRLVISGHIHSAHGIAKLNRHGCTKRDTVFVNAAIADNEYNAWWKPVVVDL